MTHIYLVENCYGDLNKVYIGKTIKSRKQAHKLTYGKQIKYTVIDQINSLNHKDWKPLESYWIEQFRQWGFNILNQNVGGGGVQKHSNETKNKMRNKQLLISDEKKKKISKPVLQYDLNGNFIKEWPSIDSVLKNGIRGVDMCVIGATKTAGGYIWRHKSDPLPSDYKIPNHKSNKGVIQYSINGNFIKEWDSIKEACLSLNIDSGTVVSHLKGRQKTAFGFIWKYKI
jgi:hypothetical protein